MTKPGGLIKKSDMRILKYANPAYQGEKINISTLVLKLLTAANDKI